MTRSMLFSVALAVGLVQMANATVIVQNGDFEAATSPTMAESNGTLYTKPFGAVNLATNAVPGWTFGPSADPSWDGLVASYYGSWGWSGVAGTAAAFVEGFGTFSQTIAGLGAGGFTVTFSAASPGPNDFSLIADSVQVKLDNTILTFRGVSSVTPGPVALTQYTSDSISIGAGAHTLTFSGLTAGAAAVSTIDNVSIAGTSTVPEPASLVLLATAILGMLAYAWRKRKQ